MLPALKLRAPTGGDSVPSLRVGCPRSSTEALTLAGESENTLPGDALFMYFVGMGGGGLGGTDCWYVVEVAVVVQLKRLSKLGSGDSVTALELCVVRGGLSSVYVGCDRSFFKAGC